MLEMLLLALSASLASMVFSISTRRVANGLHLYRTFLAPLASHSPIHNPMGAAAMLGTAPPLGAIQGEESCPRTRQRTRSERDLKPSVFGRPALPTEPQSLNRNPQWFLSVEENMSPNHVCSDFIHFHSVVVVFGLH